MVVSAHIRSQSPGRDAHLSPFSRFHSSRYPAIPKDTALKFDHTTHNHVVFIRNNRFFEVQLAHHNGAELSAADLETYEITFVSFGKIEDKMSLVLSPMSFMKQTLIEAFRSALLLVRTETLGHVYVFVLG